MKKKKKDYDKKCSASISRTIGVHQYLDAKRVRSFLRGELTKGPSPPFHYTLPRLLSLYLCQELKILRLNSDPLIGGDGPFFLGRPVTWNVR